MLVRDIVIDDQMDLKVLGRRCLDMAQELQEFLMTMPSLALGEDLA